MISNCDRETVEFTPDNLYFVAVFFIESFFLYPSPRLRFASEFLQSSASPLCLTDEIS